MLGGASCVLECEGYRQRYKIDIGDIGEELAAVKGEFAEVPGLVVVRVSSIAGRWFHETRSWIKEERQSIVDTEPYPSACDPRDGDGGR